MVTRYEFAGLACGTCLAEAMDRVRAVHGVVGVSGVVVPGGYSRLDVTGPGHIPSQVLTAGESAGFRARDQVPPSRGESTDKRGRQS